MQVAFPLEKAFSFMSIIHVTKSQGHGIAPTSHAPAVLRSVGYRQEQQQRSLEGPRLRVSSPTSVDLVHRHAQELRVCVCDAVCVTLQWAVPAGSTSKLDLGQAVFSQVSISLWKSGVTAPR